MPGPRPRLLRPALACAALLACTPQVPPPPEPVATPPAAPVVAPVPATLEIFADHPGSSAAQIESTITVLLEAGAATLPDVDSITSESRPGRSELTVTLEPGADPTRARAAAFEALRSSALPPGVIPGLGPDRDKATAVVFTLASELTTAEDLRSIALRLQRALATVPGVADIDVCGGRDTRVLVTVDPTRLTATDVSLDALARTLRTELQAPPAAAPRSIEDLAALALTPTDPPIRLRDLADLAVRPSVPACDAQRIGGGPVVVVTVHARRGAPADFTTSVRTALARHARDLPPAIQLEAPEHPPIRVALDLHTSLPDTARSISPQIPTTNVAYLRATLPSRPGLRFDAELVVFPTSQADATTLRPALASLPGVRALGTAADALDDPTREVVWIVGPDRDQLRDVARSLVEHARKSPGIAHSSLRDDHHPDIAIDIDRERLAALGVSPSTIAGLLAAVADPPLGFLQSGDQRLPVGITLGEDLTLEDRITRLGQLGVRTPTGQSVRIDSVVQFRRTLEPAALTRRDRQSAIAVELRFTAAGPGPRKALQNSAAAALVLPTGLYIAW